MGQMIHFSLTTVLRLWLGFIIMLAAEITSVDSFAQSQDSRAVIERPSEISDAAVKLARDRIENSTELSDERKKSALAFYDTTAAALTSAEGHLEEASRLRGVLQGAANRLDSLDTQLSAIEDAPPVAMNASADDMNAQTLSDLQQSLITKEANLRATRTRITDLSQELETLQRRRQLAPEEQTEAVEQISTLTEQITAMGDGELDITEQAQKTSLQARLYMRRAQVSALEQEIVSFAERQKIITANRTITQLEQQRLSEDVAALQRLTGQQRLTDANRVLTRTKAALSDIENPHPMVIAYSDNNTELAKNLGEIAQKASRLPRVTAQKRTQVDIVDADLRTATSLIELGNLSRESAATLRKLRNDTPSPAAIRADIKAINQDIAVATQARLLAQDNLRDFLPGELDIQTFADDWMVQNPGADSLFEDGRQILQSLHNQRRILLSEISSAASDHFDALTTLKTVQQSLLQSTEQLTAQLDRNLLWLPSTAAIGLSWPGDLIKGIAATFSPKNINTALETLMTSTRDNLPLVIIFVIIITALYLSRKPLWQDIARRATMVQRVQQDSYFHTPAVLLACVIIAMPLALFFMLLSVLLFVSGNPDNFIMALADMFAYLAVFTGLFLTWRAWDGDLSLFDKHFRLPKAVRHIANRHMIWFIPLFGTSTALLVLTQDSPNSDVFGGFSLAAFLITCALLSAFIYLVVWQGRHETNKALDADSRLRNYRTPLAFVGICFPIIAAIFAAMGYLETASELMYRVFISGWLFVGAYVVHGVIRRSIMIGKRRLSLRQAIERRDKAVKMREDKAAAEERGESAPQPPPIDYSEFDVETMSRQTMQLLDAIMAIAVVGFLWMIWSSLLPALTFFNGVELSSYMVDVIDPETGQPTSVERVITLWNVMQAVVIAALTFLAARNLPSFLEIFVLNRVGIDAGTRYAIVTILGYLIIAFGVFFTLDRLGLQWSELKFVVAGLSVGIGLGLQKIIANFVSGLIILFERPIRLGDYVTIGDQSGNVSRIQIRATTLVDLDNREILIPNEALISERVTNWTLSSSTTRLIVPVGIAYGSDTDRAAEVMLAELKSLPIVLETPPPQVLFMGFGDSSLDFELRVFLKCFEDRVPTRHQVHMLINKALEREGISIPFPQRDLHIINQTEPTPKRKPKAKTAKPKPKPA